MGKISAIVCDIDGTLMNINKRVDAGFPFISKLEHLHHYDTDTINVPVAECVRAMRNNRFVVLFVSGRTEIGRVHTTTQIKNATAFDEEDVILHMRPDGDYRKDSVIKQEIYTKLIEPHYDVLFVLDDRNQVVDFWRNIGLTCFQVQEGNF